MSSESGEYADLWLWRLGGLCVVVVILLINFALWLATIKFGLWILGY